LNQKIDSSSFNVVEEKGKSVVAKQMSIPPWIKNNAKWWSENRIGEDDFINGIKYLIEQQIIKIK